MADEKTSAALIREVLEINPSITANEAVIELKKRFGRTIATQNFYSIRHTWRKKQGFAVAQRSSDKTESIEDLKIENQMLKKKNQLLRDILMRCIMEE
jgi:hypothetical protein